MGVLALAGSGSAAGLTPRASGVPASRASGVPAPGSEPSTRGGIPALLATCRGPGAAATAGITGGGSATTNGACNTGGSKSPGTPATTSPPEESKTGTSPPLLGGTDGGRAGHFPSDAGRDRRRRRLGVLTLAVGLTVAVGVRGHLGNQYGNGEPVSPTVVFLPSRVILLPSRVILSSLIPRRRKLPTCRHWPLRLMRSPPRRRPAGRRFHRRLNRPWCAAGQQGHQRLLRSPARPNRR